MKKNKSFGNSIFSISESNSLKCVLCSERDKEAVEFLSEEEFISHLRSTHCSFKSGLYICRFELNGICLDSPENGFSSDEYTVHCQQYHLSNKSSNVLRKMSNARSTTSSLSKNQFNVNSFTQNLSAVLLDPSRSRVEISAFFTRHWGEHYVPRTGISCAQEIPLITVETFRHYLSTTAKKHRQYLKARRALRSVALNRECERTNIDPDEVPLFFFSLKFSLLDTPTFEMVFLEPQPSDPDELISAAERRRFNEAKPTTLAKTRPESCGSLTSITSLQNQMPIEALNGRFFRPYKNLHNRLEYYHDIVGILLNNQLENKSEEFWRTVNSYSVLHTELESSIIKAEIVRKNLQKTDKEIYSKSQKIVRLYWAQENRQRLLRKLDDIACLRDAQSTVQMLLNQNNFPKALECIETAHDVLDQDLKGVTCFRHLSSQLCELHRAIGKMLNEEFISLIQRELGRLVENQLDSGYQETQLQPVLLGLIRCRDFRFLQVLQTEIAESAKNTVRKIILSRFVKCKLQFDGFDPSSLGNLGEQITKMNLAEWIDTLEAVFNSLYLLCCRVMSIQLLILENLTIVESLNISDRRYGVTSAPSGVNLRVEENQEKMEKLNKIPSENSALINNVTIDQKLSVVSTNNVEKPSPFTVQSFPSSNSAFPSSQLECNFVNNSVDESSTKKNDLNIENACSTVFAASFLSLSCFDFRQLRIAAPYLLEHAIVCAEESAGKIVVIKSKESFLEKCNPQTFFKVSEMINEFVNKCSKISHSTALENNPLVENLSDQPPAVPIDLKRASPLCLLMQKQTTSFISNFHEQKRQILKRILDLEQWKPIAFPPIFQELVNDFLQCQVSHNVDCIVEESLKTCENNKDHEDIINANNVNSEAKKEFVEVNGEKFVVISTAFLLLRVLTEYCKLLELFPDRVSELNMNVVEILKQFNSRTCQLVLGAGALQMVGLKTISVKTLALSCRSVQLIAKFIPIIRSEFEKHLPAERQNILRHFDQVYKDYNDHIDEINKRLLNVIDNYLIVALTEWKVEEKTPTSSFQLIVKQIGKFYSGYSSVMPADLSLEILLKIHANFKIYFKQHLQAREITPHNSLTYGLAGQDFDYYIENMKAFPDCKDFPNDTLSGVL